MPQWRNIGENLGSGVTGNFFCQSGSFDNGRIIRSGTVSEGKPKAKRKGELWLVRPKPIYEPAADHFPLFWGMPACKLCHKRWAQCGLCTNTKRLHVPRTNAAAIKVH